MNFSFNYNGIFTTYNDESFNYFYFNNLFTYFYYLFFSIFNFYYRRVQFQQHKDRSQSSSKHERDVDIRRWKDPRIGNKKVDNVIKPTALENRKRKRSSSPDHERKLPPKENRNRGRSVTPEKKDGKSKETNRNTKGKKPNYHIFCICGIQTYEHGMLKCTECRRYSHAECYKTDDLSVEHICGGCAVKTKKKCINPEMENILKQRTCTKEEKSQFVFKLAVRRVLNSILREEFKHTQPGIEPDAEFLRMKFDITSSYANKILVYLFKSGFISVENGFKINEEKIREYMNEGNEDSGIFDQNASFLPQDDMETEVVINKEKREVKWKTGGESEAESNGSKSIPSKDISTINPSQPSGSLYVKKFLWPEKFLTRESRKESEPVEPIEPKDIGKQSSRPFFGQVMETMGPRLNANEQKSWNLCFKLGRKGESVQVWAFGSESEIKNLDKQINIDSYIVYWGHYGISPKTSNNLSPTSDWIIKIQPKVSCIGQVKLIVSKTSVDEEDKNVDKEQFSAKFQQPAKYPAKKTAREKNYEEKKKTTIETNQKRITDFMIPEDELIFDNDSDSLVKCTTPILEGLSDETSSSSMHEDEYCSTPSPSYLPSPDGYLPDRSVSESESD